MRQYLIGLLALCSGCASSGETVYLYYDKSHLTKMVSDITVFTSPDIAQSPDREPKDYAKYACLAKPRVGADVISRTGRAVEVKVHGNCHGYVNELYVHSNK
jgi:hypothetical protein